MSDLRGLEAAFKAAAKNRDFAEWPSPPSFAFKDVVDAVATTPPYLMNQRFKAWSQDNLAIFEALLLALHAREDLRLATARALACDLDFWAEVDDDETRDVIDRLFIDTIAEFEPPLRDWILERPGIYRPLRQRPGVDFQPMPPEQPEDLMWPEDRPLPPIDETRGVQARLARYGYAVGPIDGIWGEQSRRALFRCQLESGHPKPSGQLDAATKKYLLKGDSA